MLDAPILQEDDTPFHTLIDRETCQLESWMLFGKPTKHHWAVETNPSLSGSSSSLISSWFLCWISPPAYLFDDGRVLQLCEWSHTSSWVARKIDCRNASPHHWWWHVVSQKVQTHFLLKIEAQLDDHLSCKQWPPLIGAKYCILDPP